MAMTVGHNITLPSLRRFEHLRLLRLNDEQEAARRSIRQLGIVTSGVGQMVRYLSGGINRRSCWPSG